MAANNVQMVNDSQLTAHIPAHIPKAVAHVTVTAAGSTSQPGDADRFAYFEHGESFGTLFHEANARY